MKAEIISIGTELLLGRIVNTNAAYISRKLAGMGVDLYHQTTVGDNPERLIQAIEKAIARSDILLLTGGLGPTIDDITMESISLLTGRPLISNKSVSKDIAAYFKSIGSKPPADNEKQSRVPKGARCLRNKLGTAPASIIEYMNKVIICLPGPPGEMRPLFEDGVVPYLNKRFKSGSVIVDRTIKIVGLSESRINMMVKDLLTLPPPTTVGIYAKPWEVHLVVMSKAKNGRAAARAISAVEKKISSRLKDHIFGYDGDTLESVAGEALKSGKLTLSVAESCTGGLVSKRLTDVNGSSGYFMAGIVTYSNEAKENLLGVPRRLINRYGAVSKQVCEEMAVRIKHLTHTDMGMGITGIAGPAGGTARKPVGLVYIALVTGKKRIVGEFRFNGSRQDIRWQASQAALDMIRLNA